jgi:hypothetical protein
MGNDCCSYLIDGEPCGREATTERMIPVRADLAATDSISFPLCFWHSQAWDTWKHGEQVRDADRRAGRA